MTLDVALTAPGLTGQSPWRAEPETPLPRHDPKANRLTWTVELPAGESAWRWSVG